MKKTWQKIFIMFLVFMMCVSVVAVFSFTPTDAKAATTTEYTFENDTLRSSSTSGGNIDPEMQVVGDQVYYVYTQFDGSYWQLWTAYSNLDGSGFAATQQTFGNYHSLYPEIFVDNNRIYYVYGRLIGRWEVFTAYSNLDGSGFTPTQQTFNDGSHNYYEYDLYKYNDKVYYIFISDVPTTSLRAIYTASTNLDGSGWSVTTRISNDSPYWHSTRVLVDETADKIHYVWTLNDGAGRQIWTSASDLDGTNFSSTKRTTSAYNKDNIHFLLRDSTIHYVWNESDGTNDQIWTAQMDTDGTGWTATKLTTTAFDSITPKIFFNRQKLFYSYAEDDGTYNQLWIGESDYDGSNFSASQVTTSLFNKKWPEIFADETKAFYLWEEVDGGDLEVHTATGDYRIIIDESTTVSASVPNSLEFAIAGVTSGNACANSGGNASVTTTASTIPFGVYTGAATKIACQTLTVSTNATNGYVVTVEQNDVMTSSGGDTMEPFSGSYAIPTTWASPPGSGTESYFGFTTDDTDYSDFQTAKYGSFGANETPYTIASESEPVADEVNVISYQLEITDQQEGGTYTNTLMYIVTATY